jgi:hypothetical protein
VVEKLPLETDFVGAHAAGETRAGSRRSPASGAATSVSGRSPQEVGGGGVVLRSLISSILPELLPALLRAQPETVAARPVASAEHKAPVPDPPTPKVRPGQNLRAAVSCLEQERRPFGTVHDCCRSPSWLLLLAPRKRLLRHAAECSFVEKAAVCRSERSPTMASAAHRVGGAVGSAVGGCELIALGWLWGSCVARDALIEGSRNRECGFRVMEGSCLRRLLFVA